MAGNDLFAGARVGVLIGRWLTALMRGRSSDQIARRTRNELEHRRANPGREHGSAHFASAEDLDAAGVLEPADQQDDGEGVWLGHLAYHAPPYLPKVRVPPAGRIVWRGVGHLSTMAPTRAGKSWYYILPNLLRYRGSMVVFDPKGELYELTAQKRRQMGQRVFRFAPLEQDPDPVQGPRAHYDILRPLATEVDAKTFANLLIPEEDAGREPFFRNQALTYLAVAAYLARHDWENTKPSPRRGEGSTPPSPISGLADWLAVSETRPVRRTYLDDGGAKNISTSLAELFEEWGAHPNRSIANTASILSRAGRDDSYHTALLQTKNASLDFLDNDVICANLSAGDDAHTFDFAELKHTPTTVYVQVPFAQIDAYKSLIQLIFSQALMSLEREKAVPDIPVLCVLDEFLQLGRCDDVVRALRTHASAGVRIWLFLQDDAALQEIYPQTWRSLLGTTVQTVFGTVDVATVQRLSTELGKETVVVPNVSVTETVNSGDIFMGQPPTQSSSVNYNLNIFGKDLVDHPELLERLGKIYPDGRDGLVRIAGVGPPIYANLVPFDQDTYSSEGE